MRTATLLITLALAISGIGQAPSLADGGRIEVIFCDWRPGESPVTSDVDSITTDDIELLRSRRVSGTIVATRSDVVRTRDEQSARVLVFLRQPLTQERTEVRLLLPQVGTLVYVQEARVADGFSSWPVSLGWRYDQRLRLRPESVGGDKIRYSIDNADGPAQQGVAAEWSKDPPR